MFIRSMFLSLGLLACSGIAQAVHVVMTGGPALQRWEQLRIKPDRHDHWWANFVRASTIHIGQVLAKDPQAKVTWIIYRPGYITRGKEDGKPYTKWIEDLAHKYGVTLKWVDSGDAAISALNHSNRTPQDKIESFYYFGHSNAYAFMLDYGNNIMGVSTAWIHETDIERINSALFTPTSDCRSFGCYTGVSMSYWWNKLLGAPLWGNLKSTRYAPVSDGRLPEGAGSWVNGK